MSTPSTAFLMVPCSSQTSNGYSHVPLHVSLVVQVLNTSNKTEKIRLVLFDAAVKHIMRITRVFALPRGNVLLVGVGGSGKQSLTRLAAFIFGLETFQITPSESYCLQYFLDDLRQQYQIAGMGKKVAFMITDHEMKHESFFEYINNVLAAGEVPGLFSAEVCVDRFQVQKFGDFSEIVCPPPPSCFCCRAVQQCG